MVTAKVVESFLPACPYFTACTTSSNYMDNDNGFRIVWDHSLQLRIRNPQHFHSSRTGYSSFFCHEFPKTYQYY